MQLFCLIMILWIKLTFGSSDLNALLELKRGIKVGKSGVVLDSWNAHSIPSDGCPKDWQGISCSNGNVESIMLNDAGLMGEFNFRTISNLKLLRNLSLLNNQLTGNILEISQLESLENLDLSRNSFHGSLPSNFTQLKNLLSVNLSANEFEGLVPSGFQNLRKLKHLDLHSNRFSGNIMNLIQELGGVLVLDLSCNQFNGELNIGVVKASFVSNIQYINVSHNALVGQLFSDDGMPFFDNLEVFDGSYNRFNGTIPSFNFVVSLRILRLASNLLSGDLPEPLLQDSSMVLSELDLSLNQLRGPVGSITSTSLRSLNLSTNQFSGSLPQRIRNCVIIDLSNNKFTGNLSRMQNWGSSIEVVRLNSNSLEGSIPPILSTYHDLKLIDLSFNFLNGFLPSLSSWTKLISLNLSHNNFSVPQEELGIHSGSRNFSLVTMDLSHNNLSGNFPLDICNFHNLQCLDLSWNNLVGSIPSNLSDQLTSLNVSYNKLSGIVPENLRRFYDASFYPGNSLLIFPNSPSSAGSSSSINTKRHPHGLKQALLVSILAVLIGGATILVLLFVIMYYRSHVQKKSIKSVSAKSESMDNKSWTAAPNELPSVKSIGLSSNSPSSGQGALNESKMGFTDLLGSSIPKAEKCNEISDFSSPVCIISSSNPSPPKGQNLLGAVKICSPDKLAGDLHLFDGSFEFTAEQLSRAPAEVIGRSCHGMLYRAALDGGNMLVVKRLKEGIAKGRKEFSREMKKLASVRHPNLVSFQGYYWGPREHEKLIISNYINAPCLGIYLQGLDRVQVVQLPSLSLEKRLKAARDVTQCLDYLHNERAIPHGNLKSTNILIHPIEESVLVTDYGLHRLMTVAGTADQVLNAGVLGYLPPEFINSSKPCPSLKSDVYALGVILLELITGRSSAEIVSANQGAVDLTDWVKMLVLENRANDCFDKAVVGADVTENEHRVLDRMLQVALRCILPASERPDTKTVFQDLSSINLY